MTDFLDEVLADARPGPECSVKIVLRRLDDTDPELAARVRATLEHPDAKPAAIARALRKRGQTITDFTIRRHIRGECKCGLVA